MAYMNGATNLRNSAASGKQAFLPPKSPFPSVSSGYADHGLNSAPGPKGISRQRESQRQHQRTSSESFLLEEQPSWLDDLLNEPETPVRRGAHRRSSSDSFAYLDSFNLTSSTDNSVLEEFRHRGLTALPSWGSQDLEYQGNRYSYFTDASLYLKSPIRGRETALISAAFPSNGSTVREKTTHHVLIASGSASEPETVISVVPEKSEQGDSGSGHHDAKNSSEKKEISQAKHLQPETDQKRVKQQFAQRSRVRKLQYIAELERNVQALQAEGSEVSLELQYLDHQNQILSLENKALQQRLDSLVQEQLLKRLQQDMLEREIARLQVFCQQQRLQLQQRSRSNGRDLDTQFANLSLKHKEANSGRDTMTGPLRI